MGKKIRLERIFNRNTGKTVIVPMDHGVTLGPIEGIINIKETATLIANGGADAALVHKGAARFGYRGYGKDLGLILHLTAGTALNIDPNKKVLVTSVKEALKIGADCVSVRVNIGANDESSMLEILGNVSAECDEWGMPLLAMMYARGGKVDSELRVEYIKHAARVGAELGADIVKTSYTGDIDSFREVVRSCPVPVVIAGGVKSDSDEAFLKSVSDAMQAGAKGVAIGRNIFQHRNPELMTRRLCKIVHENYSESEVMKIGWCTNA
ncbi:MAG: 2-amino-3,7-dideoxy-D-threo-hept-6-ulosonate synthase [Methanocellales archaeon]